MIYDAIKVTDRVYWVGAIDWPIREFHGYATHRGTTYNAFLIVGEQPVLIDTVKAPFVDEMLSRISSVVDPKSVKNIISNHAELDHSGGLPQAIQAIEPETIFTSKQGAKALEAHHHLGIDFYEIKDGEELVFGDIKLTCVETKMLHWPDSMITFFHNDGVLFSQDGFGMHLASSQRFADEIEDDVIQVEASKYFANILMPYSPVVLKILSKVERLNLPIKMLAPDHGPLYRDGKNIDWIISQYSQWAQQMPTNKVVVVYDTMWNSTAAMARAICEGIASCKTCNYQLMSMGANHRSDVATELLEAGALVVGSPTMNGNIFPSIADILSYLEGLKPKNLIGAAFGSYGWSGEATARIEESFKRMKIECAHDRLRIKYVPKSEELEQCRQLGMHISSRLEEYVRSCHCE